jgi:hypothetical protein
VAAALVCIFGDAHLGIDGVEVGLGTGMGVALGMKIVVSLVVFVGLGLLLVALLEWNCC